VKPRTQRERGCARTKQKHVARLVPDPPHQDALSVFGDLYRTLDDETADALTAAIGSQRMVTVKLGRRR
jgi:hypothetical protein